MITFDICEGLDDEKGEYISGFDGLYSQLTKIFEDIGVHPCDWYYQSILSKRKDQQANMREHWVRIKI